MQDVLILLQHLTENEETTIKLMIECLYDVGTVNFINKKVQNESLNQLTKNLAGMSKPMAKRYGYYWFKKNCPELIVNWLTRKVAFPAPKAKAVKPQEAAPQVEPTPIATETPAQGPPYPQHQTDDGNAPVSEVTAASQPIDIAVPQEDIPNIEGVDLNDRAASRPQDHQPLTVSSADQVQVESQPVGENTNVQLNSGSPADGAGSVPTADTQVDDSEEAKRGAVQPLVAAPPSTHQPPETIAAPVTTSPKATGLPTPLEQQIHQIHRLKTQNKVLMSSLVSTILVGGLAIWQLHATQQSALQLRQSTPSSIANP